MSTSSITGATSMFEGQRTDNSDLCNATVEVRAHEGGFVIYIEGEPFDPSTNMRNFQTVAESDFVWPTEASAKRVARIVGTAMGWSVGTRPVR